MTKTLLLLILLTHFSFKSQSQDSLTLKIKYQSDTKYIQTMEESSQSQMKYSGSEEVLQKLKDKGIQNPTLIDQQSKTETIFKTGKLTNKTNFPITIEFVKTTSSDGKKKIPDGTLIYGHGSIDNIPILDSIVSNQLDDDTKKIFLQAMQSVFSQLSFPEKTLKIGETFSQQTPLSLPIGGVTLDMDITTNYKLLSIINGIGNFDISQVYTLKSTITEFVIKASGTGKGKLFYNIPNSYNIKYEIDTEMEMNLKHDVINIDLKTKSSFIQTTEIGKN